MRNKHTYSTVQRDSFKENDLKIEMDELDSPRKAEVDEAPTHGLKLAKIVSKGNSEGDSP